MRLFKELASLRPNKSTIIEVSGKLFYAFSMGVGFSVIDEKKYRMIYSENVSTGYGNYNSSVLFNDKVFFIPNKADHIYYVDYNKNTIDRIPFIEKGEGVYINYISNDCLMLFGKKTHKLYKVDKKLSLYYEKEIDTDYNWKTYRSQTDQYICMWDDEKGMIGLLDKFENDVKEIRFPYGKISCSGIYNDIVFVLCDDGELYMIETNSGNVVSKERINSNVKSNRLYFYNDFIYIMPEYSDQIITISLPDNHISTQKINWNMTDKRIIWKEIGPGKVICFAVHNEYPWKYKEDVFEYDLEDGSIKEYPVDMMILNSLLKEGKQDIFLHEKEIYAFDSFLNYMVDK